MHRSSPVLFSLVALIASAPRANAQVKLEGTLFFDSYYWTNTTRFVDKDNFERQEAGPGLGAALAWRFNNIWAVEAQGTYIKSGIVARSEGFINFQPPIGGHLVLGNVRVIYQPRRTNIYFALGTGSVTRKGDAWNVPGIDKLTNIETIVGFGVRARVNPQWGFKLGVEDHIYKADADGPAGGYYQSRMQNDIHVTIGVPFALIGK